MINSLAQLASPCLVAALIALPAAGQYYHETVPGSPCGCGGLVSSYPSYGDQRVRIDEGYRQQVLPSVVGGRTTNRAQAQLQYNSEEVQALYHPVVVPLDEFLSPREPAALTRDQLERQRAAAEARATPPQPPPAATPVAGTPEADPFADDAPTTGEPASAGLSVPKSAAGATAADDALSEEAMPAEQPEAESTPAAEAAPESEPADSDEDPFGIQ